MSFDGHYPVSAPEIKSGFNEYQNYDWSRVHRKLSITGVYVFSMDGAPYCKVGSTGAPRTRHSGIATSLPFNLEFPFFVTGSGGITHIQIEKLAQKLLHEKRCRGEWFKCDDGEAIAAVRRAVEIVRAST